MNPQPPKDASEVFVWVAPETIHPSMRASEGCYYRTKTGLHFHIACPFGEPGDLLIGLEEFRAENIDARLKRMDIYYRADHEHVNVAWCPARFMIAKMSRFKWHVSRVWVEQIHLVSIGDAWKSGFQDQDGTGTIYWENAKNWLKEQWNRDWPEFPWNSNPWVWCAELESKQ